MRSAINFWISARRRGRIRSTGSVRPNSRIGSGLPQPKLAAFWGTKQYPTTRRASVTPPQSRGIANTWGYGAMTNSYNDTVTPRPFCYGWQSRRGAFRFVASTSQGKELNRANFIVSSIRG